MIESPASQRTADQGTASQPPAAQPAAAAPAGAAVAARAGDRPGLDASSSWARPGKRRRRLQQRQGPGPWELVLGALAASGLAAAAWSATLVVVAVAEGRSATYPFAAVTALFRGERALGLPPTTGEVTTSVLVRGVFWTAVMAVLLGAGFAVVSRRGLPRRRSVVIGSAAVAALVVFLLGVALVGQPGGRTLQREVSSYQGFRDLGLPLVALAQVLAGLVFGAWWARLTCGRETDPS